MDDPLMKCDFDPEIRVLACRSCGAPITVPEAGGQIKCTYCESSLQILRRPQPGSSDEVIPDQPAFRTEHERLDYLATAARTYDPQNPYSTCEPPGDLEHVNLENSDPSLPDLITGAFRDAVALCEASDGSQLDQRRVYWLVHKIANMWSWRNDGSRARAAVETGSEVLTAPGYRQSMYCLMANLARKAGELEAAEKWISRCNPAPTILDLDTELRTTRTGLAMTQQQWNQALELVGRSYEEMPPARPNSIPLITLDRIACLETLGDQQAAEREMARVLEEELDPMLPILDHDFLAQWLDGSERLKAAAEVWERLKRRQAQRLEQLTKANGEELLAANTRHAREDVERRLAVAKEETPTWPTLGVTSLFSKLNAAKKLEPAMSTFIDGRGGLSARSDEDYNVVGISKGRSVLVRLYLTGGIASVRLSTKLEKDYKISFDMKYDKKGQRKYRPEPRLEDDRRPGRSRGQRQRIYFSPNVYVDHKADSFCRPREDRRKLEFIQKIAECLPDSLRERTDRYLRRSYMDVHFRGDLLYVSYVANVFWKTHPVREISHLLDLAGDWNQIIEWVGDSYAERL